MIIYLSGIGWSAELDGRDGARLWGGVNAPALEQGGVIRVGRDSGDQGFLIRLF